MQRPKSDHAAAPTWNVPFDGHTSIILKILSVASCQSAPQLSLDLRYAPPPCLPQRGRERSRALTSDTLPHLASPKPPKGGGLRYALPPWDFWLSRPSPFGG